jgi:hypothetical protein
MDVRFQLPLSGSLGDDLVEREQAVQELSTPSLGITPTDLVTSATNAGGVTFNSLSRDHNSSSRK